MEAILNEIQNEFLRYILIKIENEKTENNNQMLINDINLFFRIHY